jgi:hypothetical protein
MFVRGIYAYDVDQASLDAGQVNDEPSMTDQSFAEESDINTIVRRFGLTGELPSAVSMPTFADFEQTYDYHSAMLQIRAAEREFMRLPADVRTRFNNDPGSLVTFLEDPGNRLEAVSLGLVQAPPEPAPVPEPKVPGP